MSRIYKLAGDLSLGSIIVGAIAKVVKFVSEAIETDALPQEKQNWLQVKFTRMVCSTITLVGLAVLPTRGTGLGQ